MFAYVEKEKGNKWRKPNPSDLPHLFWVQPCEFLLLISFNDVTEVTDGGVYVCRQHSRHVDKWHVRLQVVTLTHAATREVNGSLSLVTTPTPPIHPPLPSGELSHWHAAAARLWNCSSLFPAHITHTQTTRSVRGNNIPPVLPWLPTAYEQRSMRGSPYGGGKHCEPTRPSPLTLSWRCQADAVNVSRT